ncbi:hypothetical protein trd_A0477 (plasmid) [Thermomicrobium roseum DSM 5159]|uniref:Uncharacterized protein n=1 Tax=Thermomicrobium roseum (strain ATCC 27502 / DSM 5159 / P-2) TaxID=309801 RepID=B9L3W3_THERP|nr:hypothetical protein trd_A0477 [Thermomicrobium roseum DSM 5159]
MAGSANGVAFRCTSMMEAGFGRRGPERFSCREGASARQRRRVFTEPFGRAGPKGAAAQRRRERNANQR